MLREIQLDLARAFLDDTSDSAPSRHALTHLVPLSGASAARGLDVYRNALRHVAASALGEIFPVCRALVGDACFATLARIHQQSRASRHPDLGRIGGGFAERIEGLRFLDGVPYLADVARVEWALHEAAEAPDAAGVSDPERVAEALSQAPERSRFDLPPSATRLASPYPVRAIWAAHQGGGGALETIDATPRVPGDRLVVWRGPRGLAVESLEALEESLLAGIARGASVAELLTSADASGGEGAGSLDPDAERQAELLRTIGSLFERGLITGIAPLASL